MHTKKVTNLSRIITTHILKLVFFLFVITLFNTFFRLDENYEMIPGACLPRSVLYTHYTDFCKRNQVEPSSAASFGKVS